jgi:O-antigen ligase/polysaccharide polymerase Wzy-like membrane protein
VRSLLRQPPSAFGAPFVVGALAVAVFAVWSARDAGFGPTSLYPGALFVLALAVVAVLAYGRVQVSRPALVAIIFLGAFAGWCGLSIAWASDQGIAWDAANRTFVYFLVYALFAALPWRRESIPVLLCGFSVAVLVIGLVDLARAAGDPAPFFVKGRFSAPAGYPNAACALYLLAFWPLAYVAGRREVPALLRGGLLAGATALAELALLPQSRGSLFAVPVALVVYFLVVPGRLRAATGLAVVAVTVLLARGPLLDLFQRARGDQDSSGAIHSVLTTIAISAAAVFVVWTVVAVVDRRIELGRRTVRAANLAALGLVAAALIVGAVVAATSDPGPGERLGNSWRSFKAGYPTQTAGTHFALGLGSNRYDFWRVALLEFRRHPLDGVGVDNFAEGYLLDRRSSEEPLYPHSLELGVLAQTGIVGALLFAGFLVAAGVAVVRGVGSRSGLAGGAARAGVVAALYVGIHGSGDWLWEFPALAAPSLAWLGLAASRPPAALHAARLPRFVPVALGLGAVAVTASFVFPWVAELDARRALGVWEQHPQRAFADLDRARKLNPLSTRTDILAGAIAGRVNDLPRMRLAFSRALARDPRFWYAHFELGLAEAALGHRAVALRELRRAAALNPSEEVITEVTRQVARGRPVDRGRIDRLFAERVRSRVGP